jgi:hypothetical protein
MGVRKMKNENTVCVKNGIAKFKGKVHTSKTGKKTVLIQKVINSKEDIPVWAIDPKDYVGKSYVLNSPYSIFGKR